MGQWFKCQITDLPAELIYERTYKVKVGDDFFVIRHGIDFESIIKQPEFSANKHLLAGAILNGKLFDREEEGIKMFPISGDYMERLQQLSYPSTPRAKLDTLFMSLYKMQKYDGQTVSVNNRVLRPEFYYKHFFKSAEECLYYVKELRFQKLISCKILEPDVVENFSITFEGLNYYLDLLGNGDQSNKCFVAMSFGADMAETRGVIKKVIEENGYDPVIINEQHIDSSQTINDAIIVAIKSSKFCIADFSQQRDGVYFECGYAVGLGKPVIYSCHEDWFKQSHFDTNHFPHILYNSMEQLRSALDMKIKAWIK